MQTKTNIQRHAERCLEYERRERRCEVCGSAAVTLALISINNRPKVQLPVCHVHWEAAMEDRPPGSPMTR